MSMDQRTSRDNQIIVEINKRQKLTGYIQRMIGSEQITQSGTTSDFIEKWGKKNLSRIYFSSENAF